MKCSKLLEWVNGVKKISQILEKCANVSFLDNWVIVLGHQNWCSH